MRRCTGDDLQAAQHLIDLSPRVMAHASLAADLLPAISPARTARPKARCVRMIARFVTP